MNISDRIKSIRKEKKLTQLELAEKIGLKHQSNYARFESRGNNLSFEELKKIASALGVSVQYLLFGEEQSTQDTSEKDRKIKDLEKDLELLKLKVENLELKNTELQMILKGFGYSLGDIENAKDKILDVFGNMIVKALENSKKVEGKSETDFLKDIDK
jgi:transcriptional regulator with XRE-family HTH domain